METDEVIKLVDNIYKVSFIRSILLLSFELKTPKNIGSIRQLWVSECMSNIYTSKIMKTLPVNNLWAFRTKNPCIAHTVRRNWCTLSDHLLKLFISVFGSFLKVNIINQYHVFAQKSTVMLLFIGCHFKWMHSKNSPPKKQHQIQKFCIHADALQSFISNKKELIKESLFWLHFNANFLSITFHWSQDIRNMFRFSHTNLNQCKHFSYLNFKSP